MIFPAWSKIACAVSLAIVVSGCMSPSGDTISEKRAEAQRMRADTLQKLYRIHRGAKARIQEAAGYGVFSNVGVKIFLVSAGNGWGVVRDNRSGHNTYMKMVSGGVGLGLGVKDFRGVFVFTSRQAMHDFIDNGWDASADADLAAKAGDKGLAWAGAIDVAPGIKLYQITESGLAVQAMINGTKYWPDDDLNG